MLDLLTLQRLADRLSPLFAGQRSVTAPIPAGAGESAVAWALALGVRRPVVLVTDGPQSLEERHQDLATLMPGDEGGCPAGSLMYLPAAEAGRVKDGAGDADLTGYRLQTLLTLSDPARFASSGPRVLVTCVQALLQKTAPPADLAAGVVRLEEGKSAGEDDLPARLVALGYRVAPEVTEPGWIAVKGGILDAWAPTEPWPVRVELFGTAVESLRTFDPETQRSLARLPALVLPPAAERMSTGRKGEGVSALDYLPPDALFLWSDAESIEHHAGLHAELAAESGAEEDCIAFEELLVAIRDRPAALELSLATEEGEQRAEDGGQMPEFRPVQGVFHLSREEIQPDLLEQMRARLFADLHARVAGGQDVLLFFDSAGSREHFDKLFQVGAKPGEKAARLLTGPLSSGFVCEPLGLVVVAEADLHGRRKRLDRRYAPDADRPRAPKPAGMRVNELTDIEPGDLVVHVEHGIGRYEGLKEILFEGTPQEVLSIEYADGARLHVPVSQAHLLSRYVGIARRRVELHRLGGRRWNREKAEAEKAVMDLAASLLEVQAQRSMQDGYAFPADTPWQREFEASFPYRETEDQLRVIEAAKSDMQSTRPMDRLVCGDAGYGKTEVAMRVAFKAVMHGKQVAMLVPTTVLAQQHYQTFVARMASYPVRIEMLSRFVAPSVQRRVLEDAAAGSVDILIGTHALLQPSVRFRDLGLVIVDEEQRFGVLHKEKLKQMRRLVDVLTLTATPIPRTLYMSMTGARDMSLLQTPPRERMAIETLVAKNEDRIVRDAILRELNREGQVFYLHNRIMTMEPALHRIQRLVPEARVRAAHGQMPSGELALIMRDFAAGAFDVLLSTTIIESGVDVPRANTILIDRADRFGIADLYQLRGRVGRSSRKAYAYLLLPPHGLSDPDARDRIGAVKKYSGLSAGFSLALRDLEIRGAGNLLGAEQSGYITAVGFGLYCQLLQRTVARLKGEPLPPLADVEFKLDIVELSPAAADPDCAAFVPYEFIEDERLRIAAYRKLAEAAVEADVERLRRDWRDRYGAIPPPAERLLKIALIRVRAAKAGITRVETREGKIMFTRAGDYVMKDGKFPRLPQGSVDRQLKEILAVVGRV